MSIGLCADFINGKWSKAQAYKVLKQENMAGSNIFVHIPACMYACMLLSTAWVYACYK